jgi:hypothetical protein
LSRNAPARHLILATAIAAIAAIAACAACAAQARAQQAPDLAAIPPVQDARDTVMPHPALGPGDAVTTLDHVKALPPDEGEPLDLYRFRNPREVAPNTFDKSWSPPPSPKEISENGGYLVYGFAKLVGALAKNLQGIPGIRGQVQSAVARPPPLDLEQMDRAARITAATPSPAADAAPAPPPHE